MFSAETITKRTRREHRCGLCSFIIPKGSQMQRYFVADEGDVNYGKTCMACVAFIAKHPEMFDNGETTELDIIEYMIETGYLSRKNNYPVCHTMGKDAAVIVYPDGTTATVKFK